MEATTAGGGLRKKNLLAALAATGHIADVSETKVGTWFFRLLLVMDNTLTAVEEYVEKEKVSVDAAEKRAEAAETKVQELQEALTEVQAKLEDEKKGRGEEKKDAAELALEKEEDDHETTKKNLQEALAGKGKVERELASAKVSYSVALNGALQCFHVWQRAVQWS